MSIYVGRPARQAVPVVQHPRHHGMARRPVPKACSPARGHLSVVPIAAALALLTWSALPFRRPGKGRITGRIYSRSFDGLPEVARGYVYQRLWDVLSGKDTAPAFVHLAFVDPTGDPGDPPRDEKGTAGVLVEVMGTGRCFATTRTSSTRCRSTFRRSASPVSNAPWTPPRRRWRDGDRYGRHAAVWRSARVAAGRRRDGNSDRWPGP